MKTVLKRFLAAGAAMTMLLAAGCGKADDKEGASGEIELSDSKVKIEVGDEAELEIENYDDLNKVKIEVEDEDIAEAELDDEVITVTGLSEGKTTLTISAKDCEEVTVSIKVTDSEASDPGAGPAPAQGGNGGTGEAVAGPVTATAENGIVGAYLAEFPIDQSFMAMAFGADDATTEEEAEALISAFAGLDISLKFEMILNDDHTATMAPLYSEFKQDFYNWLDVHYLDFMCAILLSSGETVDAETEEYLISMKDTVLESFMEGMEDNLNQDDSISLTWSLDGNTLTISGENRERETEIRNDGSFVLSFTQNEFGDDASLLFGNSDKIDLVFNRE